jgi:hypothetical protein
MRRKLLDHVDIRQRKGENWETVLSTPTVVEVPFETTQGRTARKARLRGNRREPPFFVFT